MLQRIGTRYGYSARFCSKLVKKKVQGIEEPIISERNELSESEAKSLDKERMRILRNVRREAKRLERGTIIASVEEIRDRRDDERDEEVQKLKISEHLTNQDKGLILAAIIYVKGMFFPLMPILMMILLLYVFVYAVFKVPEFGESLPFIPTMTRYILWEQPVEHCKWIYFHCGRLNRCFKRTFLPHLDNY